MIQLNEENKQRSLEEIKKFFKDNYEEEISDFQAGRLLDFVLHKMGVWIYNQAIQDAQSFMNDKVEELYTLEKSERTLK